MSFTSASSTPTGSERPLLGLPPILTSVLFALASSLVAWIPIYILEVPRRLFGDSFEGLSGFLALLTTLLLIALPISLACGLTLSGRRGTRAQDLPVSLGIVMGVGAGGAVVSSLLIDLVLDSEWFFSLCVDLFGYGRELFLRIEMMMIFIPVAAAIGGGCAITRRVHPIVSAACAFAGLVAGLVTGQVFIATESSGDLIGLLVLAIASLVICMAVGIVAQVIPIRTGAAPNADSTTSAVVGYPPPPQPALPPPVAPPHPGYYPPSTPQGPTNGLAIASLILSLVSCGIGSILAVIFGHIALSQIKQSQGRQGGRGLAIAGLVIGYIGLAAVLIWIVIIVIASVVSVESGY